MAELSALLVIVVLAFRADASRRRVNRLLGVASPRPARVPRLVARRLQRPRPSADRQEIADLVGRLAALTRAGVAPGRAWRILAAGDGPGAPIARVTADMVTSGGSTADGLRLATGAWTQGPPGARDAVTWLALATDVVDRSGAPSAAVYDGMATGILAELARMDEQEVALAGAKATATLLAGLPIVGVGLGFLMGANVFTVLLGTPIGRLCLATGLTTWLIGQRWTRRLVRKAAATTP